LSWCRKGGTMSSNASQVSQVSQGREPIFLFTEIRTPDRPPLPAQPKPS